MFIINNQVYYSSRERAEQAFQRLVEQGYLVDHQSFIDGYMAALEDAKEEI